MMDVNSYNDYGTADWATSNDLVEAQGLFVVLQADGQFAVASTAASADVFGVLRDNCKLNEVPAVRMGSITYVIAGEALAVGDYVTNDDQGRAVVAQTGEVILGQVLETPVDTDEEGKINLYPTHARTVAA